MDSYFAEIPRSESAFTTSDWRKFATRYCAEAITTGLAKNARFGVKAAKIKALQNSILTDMLRRGVIHRLQ
jgi:hypothetical protein